MEDTKARARANFEAWVEAQARVAAGSPAVESILRAAAKAALDRAAKRWSDEDKTA